MILNPSSLSTAQVAAVAVALTAISNGITAAQTQGAQALSLSAQIATLQAQQSSLVSGGTVSQQGPEIAAIVSQKSALATQLLTVEQAGGNTRETLYQLCQAQAPLLEQLLDLALTQLQAQVAGVIAPFFMPGSASLQNASAVTDFSTGMTAYFRGPTNGGRPTTLAATVASATRIQSILQAVSAGTDVYTLH